MEQHNFENKIKQQLQQREITPSASSWERLEAKLDAKDSRKSNKFWWLGIAAAVAVGIFIGASIFKSENILEPQFVENPSEEIFKTENTTEIASEEGLNFEKTEPNASEKVQESMKIAAGANLSETKKKIQKQKAEKEKLFRSNDVQVATVDAQEEVVENEFSKMKNENPISENESLIAKAENTDSEVEALLAKARNNMKLEATNAKASVAAQDLLREVETDLDYSFKNRVFEMMKDGLYKARTAVADRN